MYNDAMTNLANAVILQAVEDYRKILCGILPRGYNHIRGERDMQSVMDRERASLIKFFQGGFVGACMRFDGVELKRRLDNERYSIIDRDTGEILKSNGRFYEIKPLCPKLRRDKINFVVINDETGNEVVNFDGQTVRTTDEIEVADT